MTQNEFNAEVRNAVASYDAGAITERELAARILKLTAERV